VIGRYDLIGILHELRYRRSRQRPAGTPHLAPTAAPLVSVVCVTNRPHQCSNVLSWFDQQTWEDKELLIVANCEEYPHDLVRGERRTSITIPSDRSLGECLNEGFARSNGEVIVRFDDDDWYAPALLTSAVETFKTVRADVIGKQDHFAYVESVDAIVRRYEGRCDQYVGRVAGGSIAVLAKSVSSIEFPDSSLGEDIAYLRRCERAGLRIWGTPPNGYLQHRRAAHGHTWEIGDSEFTRHSRTIAKGLVAEAWM